ncbi:LeuD/DmdB family oxidoreductase small subunit [Mycobacterium sp. NPDC003449]
MIRGHAQCFGSDINTDYIIAAQHKAASLDVAEMARHTFEDIDLGFADRVRPGDVVVAGANFGCGSSRETAPRVLLAVGISAVIAPSFGRIFFRNAINVGLPVLECDTAGIDRDDIVEIDLGSGHISVPRRGLHRRARPLPDVMRALLDAGGLANYLRLHGDLVLPQQQTKEART